MQNFIIHEIQKIIWKHEFMLESGGYTMMWVN